MPEKKKEIKLNSGQLVQAYRADEAKTNALEARQSALQQALNEMVAALESVKEIKKTKKDENLLVSLGAGIYADARIANVKSVKSSLAGGVLVDSEADKVVGRLQEEVKNAQKQIAALQAEKQKVMQNMGNIAGLLQQVRRAVTMEKQGRDRSTLDSVS